MSVVGSVQSFQGVLSRSGRQKPMFIFVENVWRMC